jgi:hypothetical protein
MPFCREAIIRRGADAAPFSAASNHSLKLQHLLQLVDKPRCSRLALLRALIVGAAIALGSITAASAQNAKPQTQPSPSPAAQPPPGQTPADQGPNALVPPKPLALYNLLQKRSVIFPDIAYSTERLSPGQKFKLAVDNSVSVNTLGSAFLGSLVGQADDAPTGFGQGWNAYGKRFGSDMARSASSEMFGTFLLASALHEDPRFYAEINPGFFHAMKYSLQRVFIMQDDNGRQVVSWSRLAGPAMAEGLANVYWPERNRTVGDTLFRYGLDLATRATGNMMREYFPVLVAKMSHPRPAGSR